LVLLFSMLELDMRATRSAMVPLVLAGALFGFRPLTKAPPGRAEVYRALVGKWEGTLTYRNYSPPRQLVTLPTTINISYLSDSTAVQMDFIYDDGPNKTVYSSDRFSLDQAGTRLEWDDPKASPPTTWRIDTLRADGVRGGVVMVAEVEADDDNAPATLRETITVGSDTLRILKEARPIGGSFAYRHEYLLHRVR
jgi:hypothetical protein